MAYKMEIPDILVSKYKSSITGRLGNSKDTYFFGPRLVTNKFIINLK